VNSALIASVYGSDTFKSMDQICKENGFNTEQYTVQTEDDYILTLFRIPGILHDMHYGHNATTKPAVLFMHA
jgi:hypothetical protein